jgi:hypothetical protein
VTRIRSVSWNFNSWVGNGQEIVAKRSKSTGKNQNTSVKNQEKRRKLRDEITVIP